MKAYRRYVVGSAIATGVAVGIGLGSLIALSGAWWWILFVGIPIGIRVLGTATGILILHDRVAWVWPTVALVVAVPVAAVLPSSVAPFGLGLAVALWFAVIVGAGILDVVVDPDGRQGLCQAHLLTRPARPATLASKCDRLSLTEGRLSDAARSRYGERRSR
jgi:hypothetical protein